MIVQHKRLFAVTGLAVVGIALAAFQYWGHARPQLEFQGWVEAELIFVSADEPGRLDSLSVREGDSVDVGRFGAQFMAQVGDDVWMTTAGGEVVILGR